MENKMFTISEDVPVPEKPLSKAILMDMEVGQSVLFPREWRNKMQSKATRLKKEGRMYTISVAEDNTCRIWRVK